MSDQNPPQSSIVLYRTDDGRTRVECRFDDQTLWLTQALIAELFLTTPQNVTMHLKAIFAEGELAEAATCKDHLQVRREGTREVSRTVRHYRLEAIPAVGYRVRSPRGTQFRQWATARLSEYLVKGLTLDDERLANVLQEGKRVAGAAIRRFRITAADAVRSDTHHTNPLVVVAACELPPSATVRNFRRVRSDATLHVTRDIEHRGAAA